MRRNIIETFAFALRGAARRFLPFGIKITVVFEFMVAEALCFRTHHFAFLPFGVFPAEVESIFAFLRYGK